MTDRYQMRFEIGAESARRGEDRESCPYRSDDARGAWLAGYSSVRGR